MMGILIYAQGPNMSGAETTGGWKLLFDGKTSTGWHTYNKKTFGPAWKVVDGTLFCDTTYHVPKGEEGDICTDEVFKDFDLKYEWKIAKDGNSGVMFLVQESAQYAAPYLTGPEMQVLDNDGHADGKFTNTALVIYMISSHRPANPFVRWENGMKLK
jgi:hypothetical protein